MIPGRGRGGRDKKVHLKTHAPLGGGVGKNLHSSIHNSNWVGEGIFE